MKSAKFKIKVEIIKDWSDFGYSLKAPYHFTDENGIKGFTDKVFYQNVAKSDKVAREIREGYHKVYDNYSVTLLGLDYDSSKIEELKECPYEGIQLDIEIGKGKINHKTISNRVYKAIVKFLKEKGRIV